MLESESYSTVVYIYIYIYPSKMSYIYILKTFRRFDYYIKIKSFVVKLSLFINVNT